jgi:hypothetical protein
MSQRRESLNRRDEWNLPRSRSFYQDVPRILVVVQFRVQALACFGWKSSLKAELSELLMHKLARVQSSSFSLFGWKSSLKAEL